LDRAVARDKLTRVSSNSARILFSTSTPRLLVAAALATCFACSKTTDRASATAPDARGATSSTTSESSATSDASSSASESSKRPSKEKHAIDPKTVGTIRGVIKLDGTPPERKEMAIGNTAGCEHHPVPPLTEEVIAKDGHLANVFVYIKSGAEEWIVPATNGEKIALSQDGCMYRPRVLGMRIGQKLAVHNADPATHNVHARPTRNDAFNQTQVPSSPDIEWAPTKAEISVPFTCDVHPWMKAWVFVRENSWFAVSADDGTFSISGVPPGEYTLEAVHEKYGKKTGKVVVAPSGTGEVTISFAAN
jgi:plastocyanin